jgi:hypothetical protein
VGSQLVRDSFDFDFDPDFDLDSNVASVSDLHLIFNFDRDLDFDPNSDLDPDLSSDLFLDFVLDFDSNSNFDLDSRTRTWIGFVFGSRALIFYAFKRVWILIAFLVRLRTKFEGRELSLQKSQDPLKTFGFRWESVSEIPQKWSLALTHYVEKYAFSCGGGVALAPKMGEKRGLQYSGVCARKISRNSDKIMAFWLWNMSWFCCPLQILRERGYKSWEFGY